MRRVAAIDVGTNSVKMSIADVHSDSLTTIAERSQITRLGRYVDQTKRLNDEASLVTLAAIGRFVSEAKSQGVGAIKAVGTSALRDVANGQEFVDRASSIIGSPLEVISGKREAELAYFGATSDSSLLIHHSDLQILTFDIGGGSTELILGKNHVIEHYTSLNIGAVRLTERFDIGDFATLELIQKLREYVDSQLANFPLVEIGRIIGVGGTAMTVGRIENLTSSPHGMVINSLVLSGLLNTLAKMSLEQRRQVQGLEPERADVICAGIVIVQEILHYFGKADFVISNRGVRYGLLRELANQFGH